MRILLAIVGIISVGCFLAKPVWAEAPIAIEVEVKDPVVALYTGQPPIVARVEVIGKIRNVTKEDLSLSKLGCSVSDDWKTDNKAITVEYQNCLSNLAMPFTLKPGETKLVTIPLYTESELPAGDFHFKLGYNAHQQENPTSDWVPIKGSPFWSSDIVLHIKPPSKEDEKHWHDLQEERFKKYPALREKR